MSASQPRILVCDVGGSHISAALSDSADLKLAPAASAPYPTEQSARAFIGLIQDLANKALVLAKSSDPLTGISLAFPGPFDYDEGISWMEHKLPYLRGENLRSALADHFVLPPQNIRFLNDAAAFLLGEIGAGAARGLHKVACLTLGTGLGAAFAIDGIQIFEGHGIPNNGELWNIPCDDGILENLISTRGIRAAYKERTHVDREVVELARSVDFDDAARETFREFGTNLGNALRTHLAQFAPATVVLGGNISRSANLFLPAAQSALGPVQLELKISELFDSAALYGAALHWYRETKMG
jgi:glucokinase